MAWIGVAQHRSLRRGDAQPNLWQVRGRAVRARLRLDDRQWPAPHFALSSLEGSAVTQIKVHNAQHEFTTIKGVLEDVTDIVLNVKSLVVKNHSDSTRVLRVEKNTAGPTTAADIETDESVEILNKDHLLATLTDDVKFVMEMVVENGRGYVPSTEHSQNIQEIGIIPIDAVYSPVVRVRYGIEETRVGQKTNYDKLTLEILGRTARSRRKWRGRGGEDSSQAS